MNPATRFPELGIYLLPGHSDRPADLLDEVRAAEALGLGSAWISERFRRQGSRSAVGCRGGRHVAGIRPASRASARARW
jgi:alkanesulfonate monooxygenase SsuD/methylene tetrahydromethanopterin reductase-like flavin-dependent oxidoreductase (luciferase family)